MVQKGFNAYKMAQEQFEKVAEMLELDQTTRDLLKTPMREYHFNIPVRMDDGSIKIFKGFRIQHNDARDLVKAEFVFTLKKLPILFELFLCG